MKTKTKIKKIIGWFILILIIGALFTALSFLIDITTVLLIIGAAGVTLGLIYLAEYLIDSKD
jgi:small-conductance mechanosensitive channel